MQIVKMLCILLLSGTIQAQHHPPAQQSPYAPFKDRQIKALSPEDREGYLNGEGMGMALPAELNSYPGPKHIMELADQLALSREQRRQTGKIIDEMHQQAVALGKEIVEKEKQLDSLFVSGKIDPPILEKTVTDIASLRGRLRLTHLTAHLKMKALLTEDQIKNYNRLRGYAGTGRH
ncbi:MAG: periplasmic heavy metal sensor [Calditrichia bacterium]